MADDRKIEGAEDLISNLPDHILQHILCFFLTELAIATSLLSRRWRHVWSEIPSLSLDGDILTAPSINETIARYTAPVLKSFHLLITPVTKVNIPIIDTWIKFATSHNVENLSLDFSRHYYAYKLPDFFYNTSSLNQLKIHSHNFVPFECNVSWTSLQKLYLSGCCLSDESMAKILSGCPILEDLTLYQCIKLKLLDLSRSLRMRTLVIDCNVMVSTGPMQIVAPHIHCLRLLDSVSSCTLVDVSSLTEAKLDICYEPYSMFKADILQVMVLNMLKMLRNAKKLTFGGNFVKILSLPEIRGVPFPMLKVKALTLDTVIYQYVIPGIERLLQNSPDLEKLIVRGRTCSTIPEEHLDNYLKSKSLNPDQCWRSKDGKISLNNSCWNLQSKQLDKTVVLSDERYLKFNFKEHSLPEALSPLCSPPTS